MIAISKYNKQHPLRVFEAFAGYGSQSLAFKYLKEEYGIAKIKYKCGIAKGFYHIISFLCSFTDNNSAYWYISKIIQKTLMQVFALAQNNNIDLMEHIKLKMQYNESRPYLHGCKY